MDNDVEFDNLRNRCWENAIHSFATGKIFERRAKILKNRIRNITFSGLVLPLIVGAITIAYGCSTTWSPLMLYIASALGVIQLIYFLWSIVSKWEDLLDYSLESMTINYALSYDYKRIGENPPSDNKLFKQIVEMLDQRKEIMERFDYRQIVTEKEKRRGHRIALYNFRRKCGVCNEVPKDLKSTNCSACGKYNKGDKDE